MLDVASFIWNIIKDLIDGIISVINFLKNIVFYIPNFLGFLPTEISVLLISALSILTIVFIFRFVK